MIDKQTMILRMVIVVLALVGVFDSAILMVEREQNLAAQVCIFETACEQLRMSELSSVPARTSLSIPFLGMVGFGGLLALAGFGLFRERLGPLTLTMLLLLATMVGVGFALFLLMRQITAIGEICVRCLPSTILASSCWMASMLGIWRNMNTSFLASAPQQPVASA